jgi:hypothetical protein
LDGTAFDSGTTFSAGILGEAGEYLGSATFSAYIETGAPAPISALAAALRDVFAEHGMTLRPFTGRITKPLDWPEA